MKSITEYDMIPEPDHPESQYNFLALIASKTSDLVVIFDSETRIQWVNRAFVRLLGYSSDEMKGKSMVALMSDTETQPDKAERIRQAVSNRRSLNIEIRNVTRSGNEYWLDLSVEPVFDDQGLCNGFVAIGKNITRNKKEQERLKLLESVITHMNEAVVIFEAKPANQLNYKIRYVNNAYCEITGYHRDEVIGQSTDMLYGPETDRVELDKLSKALDKKQPVKVELLNYRKNGEQFWMHISVVPVTNEYREVTHWISIERDVTERKMHQKRMEESLREKEVLLSEIHHRVKNNLAVISGMMQLQAAEESDNRLSVKLLDSVTRIKTIANIHEQLYESDSFARMNLADSIKQQIQNLIDTFRPESDISLHFKCQPVCLNMNQAIPFSLIVNEVITNILKHAFKNRESGTITSELYKDEKMVILSVRDDGVGISDKKKKINEQASLGFQIIETLSGQLKGDYSLDSDDFGTCFRLAFPST